MEGRARRGRLRPRWEDSVKRDFAGLGGEWTAKVGGVEAGG